MPREVNHHAPQKSNLQNSNDREVTIQHALQHRTLVLYDDPPDLGDFVRQ